jgi:hypothetical protein
VAGNYRHGVSFHTSLHIRPSKTTINLAIVTILAPALEALEYRQVMFRGEFLAPSVWRGTPNKDLDEAWDNITLAGLRDMRIEMSDLERLNKTLPTKSAYLFDDGKDGVVVLLEVFHQLHCLVRLQYITTRATSTTTFALRANTNAVLE